MKIGVLPLFVKNLICNPDWVAEFVGTVEEEGVESIRGVEHVLMAENYAPNYPYSSETFPGLRTLLRRNRDTIETTR